MMTPAIGRHGRAKYEQTVWSKIQDYVLEEYGHVLKDAVPLLENQVLHKDYMTPKQLGILDILTKKGFFDKRWTVFKGSHYIRTDQPYETKKK